MLQRKHEQGNATLCWKEAGEWGMMEQNQQHRDRGVDWVGLAFGGQNEELRLDCQELRLYQTPPPNLESREHSALTFESGSVKLRGASCAIMKQ